MWPFPNATLRNNMKVVHLIPFLFCNFAICHNVTNSKGENLISKLQNEHNGNTNSVSANQIGSNSTINLKMMPAKIRKPVKLNMKQNLIMNQVLATYGLTDVNNSLCKDHVSEFKLGLRALEPWALKMFDSSSKLMAGIIGGNIAELGAYNECLNIYEETSSGPIRGRHCTLFIRPTDKLIKIILEFNKKLSDKHYRNLKDNILSDVKLIWSVCVPESCHYRDVLRHFDKMFQEVTEGLNLTLYLDEAHCVALDDLPKFTKGDYIYLFCVAMVLVAVLICSIIDTINQYPSDAKVLISLFSLKRNCDILFSTKKNNNDIGSLHGIRFLTMYLIVYGHRFVHNLATPVINYLDLVEWLESYYSTTIHGGTMTVDTFIVVASTLVSYMFFGALAKGTKINVILFYLNRHLRLLVPLLLAIGTYATVTKHFGSGPVYGDFSLAFENSCSKFWWSALLYIQPFINPRDMCIVQTWFLSVDLFWYYLAPFLLLAIASNQLTGYMIIFTIFTGCTAINFYVAWVHEFNGQMPVSPGLLSSDYFAYHYTQPLVRGGPYLLGLAFGHVLFRTKDRKVEMSRVTKSFGWIFVAVFMPFTVLISRSFRLEDFVYNRLYASLFLATHRTVWTLCLIWVVWCCQNGHAGPVNAFLSCTPFKILGRLCYNVFLFHYLFQGIMQNSKKAPTYFSNFLSIFDSLADMVLMLFLAVPLTLCFEYPFNRMCGLLFKPKPLDKTKVEPLHNGA